MMTSALNPGYACDYYEFSELLSDAERSVLARLRDVLTMDVRPVLSEYWESGEFPYQVMPKLIALDLMAPAELTAGGATPSALYAGFRNFELARTDASIATMYNAQSGLFRTAVRQGGSPQQAAELDRRCHDRRCVGHLRPGSGGRAGQGVPGAPRIRRCPPGKDSRQNLSSHHAERRHLFGRGTGARFGPAGSDQFVQGRRRSAALDAFGCGGNGITLHTDVARFHADAEAVYSYEGTHEINALIVGRSITGFGPFTR